MAMEMEEMEEMPTMERLDGLRRGLALSSLFCHACTESEGEGERETDESVPEANQIHMS